MDVAEISKLDSYLKRLFGSPRIRVVPRPQRDDYAEVLLGEELFGRIVVDDEDDERSYNFEKSITLSGTGRSPKLDNETVAKLNVYLKQQLGEKFSVRKRPTKTDSADLHAGDEFVGVLFADEAGFRARDGDPGAGSGAVEFSRPAFSLPISFSIPSFTARHPVSHSLGKRTVTSAPLDAPFERHMPGVPAAPGREQRATKPGCAAGSKNRSSLW